jgi:hypothetical protein
MGPEGSLPCSQQPATGPYPQPDAYCHMQVQFNLIPLQDPHYLRTKIHFLHLSLCIHLQEKYIK